VTAIGTVGKTVEIVGSLTTNVTTVGEFESNERYIHGIANAIVSTQGFVTKITGIEGSANVNVITEGTTFQHRSPSPAPPGSDRLVPKADITLSMQSTGEEGWTELNRHVDFADVWSYIAASGPDLVGFFDLSSATGEPFEAIEGARIEIPCDYINTGKDAAIRVLLYNDVQLLFSTVVMMPETDEHPKEPLIILLFDVDNLNVPYPNRGAFSIYLESELTDQHTKPPKYRPKEEWVPE
jgi:hypothetical protein